ARDRIRGPRMSLSSPPSPPAAGVSRTRWRAVSAALVVALAGVMLATVLDYGMTGDEGVQHRYARRVLRWYATLGADRSAVADEGPRARMEPPQRPSGPLSRWPGWGWWRWGGR